MPSFTVCGGCGTTDMGPDSILCQDCQACAAHGKPFPKRPDPPVERCSACGLPESVMPYGSFFNGQYQCDHCKAVFNLSDGSRVK